jgi:hypothetical protein
MTDRDIVERVAMLIERAMVKVRARRAHHKTPYVTCIRGAPAVALMQAVHPHMGSLRKPQIERAIASWHGHRSRSRRRATHCSATNCSRPGSRRGLCERHYDRWWKAQRRGRTTDFGPVEAPAPGFAPIGDGAEMNEECAVAWLAGLLEGEGAFTLNRYSPQIAYPVIKLQMCDRSIVARAAEMLGAPGVWRKEPEMEKWRPTYTTAITGPRAARWMRRLRDLMGIRRRAAIDKALAAYHPIRLVDAPATCVVPGCHDPHRGRGLCHKHYMMWSRDRAKGRDARIAPLR